MPPPTVPAPAKGEMPLPIPVWVGLSLLWVVIGLIFAAQTVWLGGFSWHVALGWAILDWGLWVVLAPPVAWLAQKIPVNAATWRWALPTHAVLALLVAVLIETVSVLAFSAGWMPDPRPHLPAFEREPGVERTAGERFAPPSNGARRDFPGFAEPRPGGQLFDPTGAPRGDFRRRVPMGTGRARLALPIYFLIVAGVHALGYHRRSLERERRALLAEARLADARLLAMQTQLQPHFFFNALNTVASLVHTRPAEAEEMICALGGLMRGVIDFSGQRELPLRVELQLLEQYLAVQQIRFGDRLAVRFEAQPEAMIALIPTLVLQPLVENAVVHGVAPFPSPGWIRLGVQRRGEHLLVQIENSCGDPAATPAGETPGEPLAFHARVGLGNTRERLAALHGDDAQLSQRRGANHTVLTEVILPWRT